MSWRPIPAVFAAFLAIFCMAQEPAQEKTKFEKPGIQMLITIREHNTGAENVTIRMIQAGYPVDVFRQQLGSLSGELNNSMRGLRVEARQVGGGRKESILSASFAVDGLLAPQKINLQPLLRAFVGAPEPFAIENVQINLDGVQPDKTMVQSYSKEGVLHSKAVYFSNPPGVEYRIKLETQVADEIEFPSRYEAPVKEIQKKAAPPTDNRPLLIGLFVAAGLALGALVYFALTRPRGKRG